MYKVERTDGKVRVIDQSSGQCPFEADEDSYIFIQGNPTHLKEVPDYSLLVELGKKGRLS